MLHSRNCFVVTFLVSQQHIDNRRTTPFGGDHSSGLNKTDKMWKSTAGRDIDAGIAPEGDDDWETDPDFVNDVNEQEQRWGSKTVAGSGRSAASIDMQQLREETERADAEKKQKDGPKSSHGYGGKFGVEKDRIDKCAATWEHKEKLEKHASQKDYSTGFGGKFGVQSDRVDKSAVGWDHVEKVDKHESQKDYSAGFGGKFGVQSDRVDKSAVGWDHLEAPQKHESQLDHKVVSVDSIRNDTVNLFFSKSTTVLY